MTETKCGAFGEVKKLNKRIDSLKKELTAVWLDDEEMEEAVAWHEIEIEKNRVSY